MCIPACVHMFLCRTILYKPEPIHVFLIEIIVTIQEYLVVELGKLKKMAVSF